MSRLGSTPVPGLQLRLLHTFVTIVEAGTLTAAAERLYKTQGAVSHDLKSLERITCVRLIDRDGQRIQLTPEGAAFLPHAEELLARSAAAETEMRELKQGRRGVIRVGALPSLARNLSAVIGAFRDTEPGTTVRLVTGQHERLSDALAAGRLDLVLAESERRDGIAATVLGSEEFRVVLPASDPLRERDRVSAADLPDRHFIGFNRELETPRMAERFFATVGRYPDPVVEASEFWLILDLVEEGVGYGLLPASVVDRSKAVAAVRTEPPLVREIALWARTQRVASGRVRRFQELAIASWDEA